jgi:hypothetical protein
LNSTYRQLEKEISDSQTLLSFMEFRNWVDTKGCIRRKLMQSFDDHQLSCQFLPKSVPCSNCSKLSDNPFVSLQSSEPVPVTLGLHDSGVYRQLTEHHLKFYRAPKAADSTHLLTVSTLKKLKKCLLCLVNYSQIETNSYLPPIYHNEMECPLIKNKCRGCVSPEHKSSEQDKCPAKHKSVCAGQCYFCYLPAADEIGSKIHPQTLGQSQPSTRTAAQCNSGGLDRLIPFCFQLYRIHGRLIQDTFVFSGNDEKDFGIWIAQKNTYGEVIAARIFLWFIGHFKINVNES